ncbi:MAG: IS1182 family transposase [Phycisphaerae bacterium]|nr:IS1182 family transposase [Phycisphaerae bacterium]
MAYRYGDRNQNTLFPQSIDEYIPQDASVRAYDVIIGSLDFDDLGIKVDPHKVGCPEYDPKVMLKLLVYGYSYGVRSSRKLEREANYNLSFIWLIGGLKPDHKTIAEFRRKNKPALQQVLKQCARLCIRLGLIEGNTLFVDGSKFRANASMSNNWTEQRCQNFLKNIDKRIQDILLECESADEQEKQQQSLIKMRQDLEDHEVLKSKVETILNELKVENIQSTNTTDPDSKSMRTRQGPGAGYNAQVTVDKKHGLIVNSDVVSDNHDYHQFSEQINQANEVLGKQCEIACADAGYADTNSLEMADEQGIKIIVPSRRQVSKKGVGEFEKSRFKYDSQNDVYICPKGEVLKFYGINKKRRVRNYAASIICQDCKHFGKCTKSKRDGRKISRLFKEELREKLEALYDLPSSKKIYALRKQKVELTFGHIKRNLNVSHFLLRGLDGVKAELSLLSGCFNIVRMINIIGVCGLVEKLAG